MTSTLVFSNLKYVVSCTVQTRMYPIYTLSFWHFFKLHSRFLGLYLEKCHIFLLFCTCIDTLYTCRVFLSWRSYVLHTLWVIKPINSWIYFLALNLVHMIQFKYLSWLGKKVAMEFCRSTFKLCWLQSFLRTYWIYTSSLSRFNKQLFFEIVTFFYFNSLLPFILLNYGNNSINLFQIEKFFL